MKLIIIRTANGRDDVSYSWQSRRASRAIISILGVALLSAIRGRLRCNPVPHCPRCELWNTMYRTRPTQASVQCLRDAHVIWCENSRLAQGHKTDRCHVKQRRKLITLSRRRPGSLPEEIQDSISVRIFFIYI